MLTPPAIADETIITCLRDEYDLHITHVTFLPLGADANTAVFRVVTQDGIPYFLKLRRGNFNRIAVDVPAFLHARGIERIMAPLTTTGGRLSVRAHGFDWMLYHFVEGKNGWQVPLSQAQWVALGMTVHAFHTVTLPPELRQRLPHEAFGPRIRDSILRFDREAEQRDYPDPIMRRFVDFWIAHREQSYAVIERAEQLAQQLRERELELVLCHTDMHAGNILISPNGEFAVVDWDEPMLAPKERDLMFVGGGFYGDWHPEEEAGWFYTGYGPTTIDQQVLAYYHYERIVMDFDAYAKEILDEQGSAEDREQGLGYLMSNYDPGNTIEVADRVYLQIPWRLTSASDLIPYPPLN